MARAGTKSRVRQVKRVLRNADDILHLFTGKRLKNIVGTGINLFGEELAKKAANIFAGPEELELPPDSPYRILGVHPEAMDVVVKGAYRALAREYHPDTGAKPDTAKFQAATEAYNKIIEKRKAEFRPSPQEK
ncbi:J domain-containing protein [Patescibacteria group bacterium]|nr:J domain-containing protein [Patescibacteria group bacterium]